MNKKLANINDFKQETSTVSQFNEELYINSSKILFMSDD